MSASESTHDPDVLRLGEDHKELRQTMVDLFRSIARVEGKIDTQTQLLEKFSERQDRGEARVDKLEMALDRARDRIQEQFQTHDEKLSRVQQKVWMGVGAATVLSICIPIILKVWSMTR